VTLAVLAGAIVIVSGDEEQEREGGLHAAIMSGRRRL
jgi:hypothetical protein